MTGNPYRNAAQDPEVMARNAKDQQQASPEAIERYRRSFAEFNRLYAVPSDTPDMLFHQIPYREAERYKMSFERHHDQAKIAHAIAAYEETRMSARPNPKFILTAVRSAFELAAVVGGLASIVAVLIVISAMM